MTSPEAAQPPPDQPEDSTPEGLQHRLQEMQERIALLESELSRVRPPSTNLRSRLRALASLLVAVALAAVPPLLVVADRWLKILSRDVMHREWCQSSYLCQTWLPSYFLVAFACMAGLLIFMFFQRHRPVVVAEHGLVAFNRPPVSQGQAKIGLYFIAGSVCGFALIVLLSLINQQYPGWSLVFVWLAFMTGCFLRAFAVESIAEFWRRHGEFWISILLAYLSLIAALAAFFGQPQIFGATAVLVILATANLWRFCRRIPPIFWIVALALIVYTININSWWTAVVGDEYDFHDVAERLAEQTSFLELDQVLFKADGVFGTHPYFSSILQAISMKFLGSENFGWRFSNAFLSALSVGLLYFFCTTFISKRSSLIAAFLLAVSSYLMSFGKIGYNNLQALFALALVLATVAWTLRSRLPLVFACLGSAVALCFYVFPAALYVVPVPILLLAFYYPPATRAAAKHWAIMLAVAAALIFPLVLQPIYWQTKIAGTLFNRSDLFGSFGAALQHFASNIMYAFFSFLYVPQESHFVASSYLDPITAALFLIGFCLLIYQMRRQRFAVFVLLSFAFFLFSVGASHDRETPPNTRMFLLLPSLAIMATWGMIWVEEKARQAFPGSAGKSFAVVPILLVVITGLNLFQAYPLAQSRFTGLQQIESLFIRISQHVHEAEPTVPKTYAVVVNESWGVDGLRELQKIYPHLAWAQIHQIRISAPVLPESNLPLIADRNTIVILTPWLDQTWVAALEAPLRASGKEPCVISTSEREPRFVLYRAPDLPQACYP